LGYIVFWGTTGQQGILWLLAGLLIAVFLTDRRITVHTPLLLPSLAGLIVSACGVIFQTWLADTTPISTYLIRVCLAAGSAWLFSRTLHSRNPILDWLTCALAVLALAQIAPTPLLNFGMIAAGILSVMGAFPAAALAGLALDLAGITQVSMTAVLCGSYLIRFLPRYPKWMGAVCSAFAYLLVAYLNGHYDLLPLPGLLLGGIIGVFLPGPTKLPNRRGETGVAQVRLEMAAGVLAQTQQLLLEAPETPVDEDALVVRAAEQACAGCPCRKNCKDSERIKQLTGVLLHKPLLTGEELPIICRKSGRFLANLHHAQEQLRAIRADRQRQSEYRAAVVQQYRFLSEYLQELSDGLARRADDCAPLFEPKVHIYGNRPAADNGDRCIMFAGTGCRYYVLLCDGMGTGLGAVQEGKTAADLLRRLLTAGYPADYALRSLNSLCALRSRAGAVTVDLLELDLETGKGFLYKWGAAPSYLICGPMVEKIGTAGPPPGLSVTDCRETTYRLSLRRGELLLLVSDGVGEEDVLRRCVAMAGASPEELAKLLLTCSQMGGEDDATVVTVQLGQRGS
jgi:stage II sporulation protein E